MILPPEILEKILEHIPANHGGRRTLVACALVATWWTGSSQRRLFSSVTVRDVNYERWMSGVVLSRSKAHLLEYVRSLWHCRSLDIRNESQMRSLMQNSGEYLSALRHLRDLALHDTRIEYVGEKGNRICFSAFRETLTNLSLDTVTTSFGAFVALVDSFPNITSLQLRSFVLEPDGGPIPPLSRPLRGRVRVHHVRPHCLDFFNRFAELDLEYEELVVGSSSLFSSAKIEFLERALQMCPSTVKFLRLSIELHCE